MDQEMLRMSAALTYAQTNVQRDFKSDPSLESLQQLVTLKTQTFGLKARTFEKTDMFDLRVWYWVWKLQGFPPNGYTLIK